MIAVYDGIGGEAAVDAAVDIFYRKVLADKRVNEFFTTVDMEAQREKQKAFLTMAFGGPNNYTGKDMREGHKAMNLNEGHFNAIAESLEATLEELSVPQASIDQILAIVATTKDDVLNR
ncbi:MAG: group 1 truncated hemoglobin [Candidatus Reddybacter sp.]